MGALAADLAGLGHEARRAGRVGRGHDEHGLDVAGEVFGRRDRGEQVVQGREDGRGPERPAGRADKAHGHGHADAPGAGFRLRRGPDRAGRAHGRQIPGRAKGIVAPGRAGRGRGACAQAIGQGRQLEMGQGAGQGRDFAQGADGRSQGGDARIPARCALGQAHGQALGVHGQGRGRAVWRKAEIAGAFAESRRGRRRAAHAHARRVRRQDHGVRNGGGHGRR